MLRAAEGSRSTGGADMINYYHGATEARRRSGDFDQGRRPTTNGQRRLSVHRVVLRNHPLPIFVLSGDGEDFLVGGGLAWIVEALAAIVQDGQRRVALPLRQFPGEQRMLLL